MPRTVKQRRFHRKSKRGCLECKRRHIKCDEHRPICINCRVTHRSCNYADPESSPEPAASARNATPGASDADAETLAESASPPSPAVYTPPLPSHGPPSSPTIAASDKSFTFLDLRLLHHAEHISKWLAPTQVMSQVMDTYRKLYIETALATPYLMNQILALSATHLATLGGPDAGMFTQRAAELETRALNLFNQAQQRKTSPPPASSPDTGPASAPPPDAADTIPRFLFPGLVAMRVLSRCLASPRDDFDAWLTQLTGSLHVLRGTRVVAGGVWEALKETKLWELLSQFTGEGTGSSLCPSASPGTPSSRPWQMPEYEPLSAMLRASALDGADGEACLRASEGLEFARRRIHIMAELAVQGWPNFVTTEFVELLRERSPEALVILAHFGAMMDHFKRYWIFDDAGAYIVRNVGGMIDARWREWLPVLPPEES